MKKTIFYLLGVATLLILVGCGSGTSDGTTGTQTTGSYVGQPPVANAGADITVETGQPITLDGSGSSDPDGSLVSYEWRAASGEGIKSASPTLALGSLPIGTYTATLIVTDSQSNTATDTMTITVVEATTPVPTPDPGPDPDPDPENVPPVANAGADQTITEGDDLNLDGSASTDEDGTIVKYEWYLDTAPDAITLGDKITLTGLTVGTYTIVLKVTDYDGATDTSTMIVTVEEGDNTPPIITLLGDATVNVVKGTTYTDAGATAADDTDGDITANIVTVDPVDANTNATYTITYNVTDAAGNQATEVTRTVIVADPDCPDGSSFITHNGTDYCTVTSPHTSKVWLDRNLGASQVCTAYNDTDCYGDYYQWGRDADGHEKSNSTTEGAIVADTADLNNAGTEFIKSASDWASVDQDPATLRIDNWSATDGSSVCPADYRVPTKEEFEDETTGVSPAVNSREDAYNSFLKLPSAGYRIHSSGSLDFQGSNGYLWSASVDGSSSWYLTFGSGNAVWGNDFRAYGRSVRCLRD